MRGGLQMFLLVQCPSATTMDFILEYFFVSVHRDLSVLVREAV